MRPVPDSEHMTLRRRLVRSLAPLSLIAFLIAVWWFWVVATDNLIIPTPGQVFEGGLELVKDGSLGEHILASLQRVATGFFLAVACAIPLGLWMGRVDAAFLTINPVVQMLRPIPPIAWIPLAILLFGVGTASPIFLIFIASAFPMVLQTASAVHGIDTRHLWVAENFGVSKYQLFKHVIIPAVLPQMIVGMRISLGVAWLVVVGAEMIALPSGLGFLIIDARNGGNRYDLVVVSMMVIGTIGLILDILMRLVERALVKW